MEDLSIPDRTDRFSVLFVQAHVESLVVNKTLHLQYHRSKMLSDRVAELELHLNYPTTADRAQRAKIGALKRTNAQHLQSLWAADQQLQALREEKSQAEGLHKQTVDQLT
ncbi:uncharacterized protein LOC121990375 [Zingiber officinale]|uniref:uncharacterized protein LOC121990375 n=1 Tax=Zingiber officinale TaxID=94328 RepID=UPI001C4DD26B|nr:uncharacterized protein LOC121990375 [Zingiber officinale]